jgi:hypothetical protein
MVLTHPCELTTTAKRLTRTEGTLEIPLVKERMFSCSLALALIERPGYGFCDELVSKTWSVDIRPRFMLAKRLQCQPNSFVIETAAILLI